MTPGLLLRSLNKITRTKCNNLHKFIVEIDRKFFVFPQHYRLVTKSTCAVDVSPLTLIDVHLNLCSKQVDLYFITTLNFSDLLLPHLLFILKLLITSTLTAYYSKLTCDVGRATGRMVTSSTVSLLG